MLKKRGQTKISEYVFKGDTRGIPNPWIILGDVGKGIHKAYKNNR